MIQEVVAFYDRPKNNNCVVAHYALVAFSSCFSSFSQIGQVYAHAEIHRPLKWPSVTTWQIPLV